MKHWSLLECHDPQHKRNDPLLKTLWRRFCSQTRNLKERWHGLLTVQSPGRPLKVLKQSAYNFFSGDVIPGCYGLLQSARRRFLFFAKIQILTTIFLAAVLSNLPLCQRSVSLVSTQITEPWYESTKARHTFIYSQLLWFRFRKVLANILLQMLPFGISFNENAPLKFLMTKRLKKITNIYLSI